MQGRGFLVSATWNAPASIFDNPAGYLLHGAGVDDVLLQISATYRFAGYTVLDHYGLFDVFHAGDVANGIARLPAHLDAQLTALGRSAR